MTRPALHQQYFTSSDVTDIVDQLMSLMLNKDIVTDKKVAATMGLNTIQVARDRLGMDQHFLQTFYSDRTIVPEPLIKMMGEYLEGRLSRDEAEKILDGLQADMKQNYFQRKIRFDDPSKLPLSAVFNPNGMFTEGIKANLEEVLAEYVPREGSKAMAEEFYQRACENLAKDLDAVVLTELLAEIIVRKDYPLLMTRIGARDPTSQEFAVAFVNALNIAYEKMGFKLLAIGVLFDREKVIQERAADQEIYART